MSVLVRLFGDSSRWLVILFLLRFHPKRVFLVPLTCVHPSQLEIPCYHVICIGSETDPTLYLHNWGQPA